MKAFLHNPIRDLGLHPLDEAFFLSTYLLIGMIPESPIDVSFVFKGTIQLIAGPTYIAIAIILWLVVLFKGDFKHAKNKNSM